MDLLNILPTFFFFFLSCCKEFGKILTFVHFFIGNIAFLESL